MKKRILAVILSVTMLLSLAACGGEPAPDKETDNPPASAGAEKSHKHDTPPKKGILMPGGDAIEPEDETSGDDAGGESAGGLEDAGELETDDESITESGGSEFSIESMYGAARLRDERHDGDTTSVTTFNEYREYVELNFEETAPDHSWRLTVLSYHNEPDAYDVGFLGDWELHEESFERWPDMFHADKSDGYIIRKGSIYDDVIDMSVVFTRGRFMVSAWASWTIDYDEYIEMGVKEYRKTVAEPALAQSVRDLLSVFNFDTVFTLTDEMVTWD